jgi:hypothetical protein
MLPATWRAVMEYEEGMQLIWDVVTRTVVVIFRGEVTSFDSRAEAIAAGEQVCRNMAWLVIDQE